MHLFWWKLRVTIVKIHSTNIVLDQRRPNLEQLKTIGTCIVNTYLSWFGVNLMFLKEYFFRMHKSSQLPARHQLWLLKLVSKRLHGLLGQDYVEQMDALCAGNHTLRVLYKEVAESKTSGWAEPQGGTCCIFRWCPLVLLVLLNVCVCVSVPLT